MSPSNKWQAVFENEKPLTESELKEIKSLTEDEKNALTELIVSSPTRYLPRLELFGTDGAAIVLSVLQRKNDSLKILEVCKEKLKGVMLVSQATDFYLSIYANVTSKYEIDDPGVVPMVLSLLGNPGDKTHAIAVFLIVSVSKIRPAQTANAIASYLSNIVDKDPQDIAPTEYTLLFETLSAFFPVFPEQLKDVYTSNGCKNAFLYQVTRLTSGSGEIDPQKVAMMLQAVSLTCIHEASRHFNSQNYLAFLISGSNMSGSSLVVSLSLLCIAKLWNFKQIELQISQKTVLSKLMALLKSELSEEVLLAVLETLTYLSLSGTCRALIFKDEDFTEKLVKLLKNEKNSSNAYGALLVFSNLTKLNENLDDNERRRMKFAASAANTERAQTAGVSDESVKLYNVNLLKNHKLASYFGKLDSLKENLMSECVNITFNLSEDSENAHRRNLVQQGGLVFILDYLTTYSDFDKAENKTRGLTKDEAKLEIRLNALRALANMCMSVDPRLAFKKHDVRTVVPFLTELLDSNTSFGPSGKETATDVMAGLLAPVDKFKALLALTNLCSQTNAELSNLIISRTFERYLKNLMIESTNPDIQRASWELINNLISQPAMLAKFFNTENALSMTNLEILIKMLHAQDERLQEVIAGLLANSTMEFDLVPSVILNQKTIFDKLRAISADVLQNQADASGLMLRLGTFLGNLMDVAESEENTTLKNDKQLLLGFKNVIQTTNIPEVYELFGELLQMAV